MFPLRRRHSVNELHRESTGDKSRGQALVELAILLPILLFMAVGVFDFARAFTTAITVEAAAREAADFGGLYPWHWRDAAAIATTRENMQTRACSAASTLTDYVGDDPADGPPVTCSNPQVTITIIPAPSGTACDQVPRDREPCLVQVTAVHRFSVIVPLRLQFGDTVLGLPPLITLTRDATFAVSNFEIDEDLAP